MNKYVPHACLSRLRIFPNSLIHYNIYQLALQTYDISTDMFWRIERHLQRVTMAPYLPQLLRERAGN